jgi:NAD(P)H-hydrate repair Nnr-like enzyme with NAD(P)H-hydrate epimerase domain
MQLATSMQSSSLDDIAMRECNLDNRTLMDNATTAFVLEFEKNTDKTKKICIFCGRGKNGGDGFYIAKKLREKGYIVTVVPCFTAEDNINPLTKEAIEEVVINAINGSEVIRTNSNQVDLSTLTPSMYFVNIMLQNGDVVRSKVIRK